ncbi:hypothetical protein [Streptomyces mirabilis]|uniref:hypothetical protein n=1 Tax=Streptomyces mirabilis TaxID=68239 RepID=UPI0033D42ADB
MLVHASSFTVDLGENGYLIGFTDDYEYPREMPFGWPDAWPEEEPPLHLPPSPDGTDWVRMRLYCHTDDPEPGIGDHGERHLVQLWRAPRTPPAHPEITEADRRARVDYAADMAIPGMAESCHVSFDIRPTRQPDDDGSGPRRRPVSGRLR